MTLEQELKRANRRMAFHDFCENVKRKTTNALHWVVENKEGIILLAGGLGIAAKFGTKALSNIKVCREQWYKDHHIYDHSTGAYVEIKHKLNQDEWKKIHGSEELRNDYYGGAIGIGLG